MCVLVCIYLTIAQLGHTGSWISAIGYTIVICAIWHFGFLEGSAQKEPAPVPWYSPVEPVDGMGMPLACRKPLCAPGDHHPLCELHTLPAQTHPARVQLKQEGSKARKLATVNFDALTEWMGSALGIAGALILAMHTKWSAYGWIIFLLSNFAWIVFAYRTRLRSMLVMQLVFTGTSVLGIYQWILRV